MPSRELPPGTCLPDATTCPSWPETPWPLLHLTSHFTGRAPASLDHAHPGKASRSPAVPLKADSMLEAGVCPERGEHSPMLPRDEPQPGRKHKSDAALKSICWGQAVPNSRDLLQLPLSLGYKEGFHTSTDLNPSNICSAHNSFSLSTLPTLHILLFTFCALLNNSLYICFSLMYQHHSPTFVCFTPDVVVRAHAFTLVRNNHHPKNKIKKKKIKSPSSNCYLILDQENEQVLLREANLWGI